MNLFYLLILMSSPTKSLVDVVKSKIVSSPTSMSPSTPQEEVGITHLKEQLRECRSRIQSDKDHIENMEIKMKYFQEQMQDIKRITEKSLIEIATLKVENQTLEEQLIELKLALEKKYETTLQDLERCGIIRNPASKKKTIEVKNEGMDALDKLLQDLQSSIDESNSG